MDKFSKISAKLCAYAFAETFPAAIAQNGCGNLVPRALLADCLLPVLVMVLVLLLVLVAPK